MDGEKGEGGEEGKGEEKERREEGERRRVEVGKEEIGEKGREEGGL